MIIVGLLVASGLMARVNDAVALVGFALSAALGLFDLEDPSTPATAARRPI